MDRQLIKRMAAAGAFTALVIWCVVIFSADFFFFPGRPDWKRAFFADHFFIANLHWLVGLSVAGAVFVFSKNPFNLPPKKCPTQGNLNDIVKGLSLSLGLMFWFGFLWGGARFAINGESVRQAAIDGDLPGVVFYTRLHPATLMSRFREQDVCYFGAFNIRRELFGTPSMEYGSTLLHFASGSGNPELVRYLIDKGLSVRDTDSERRTPLHYALYRFGNVETVRILLQNGADPFSRDSMGKSPISLIREEAVRLTFVELARPRASCFP